MVLVINRFEDTLNHPVCHTHARLFSWIAVNTGFQYFFLLRGPCLTITIQNGVWAAVNFIRNDRKERKGEREAAAFVRSFVHLFVGSFIHSFFPSFLHKYMHCSPCTKTCNEWKWMATIAIECVFEFPAQMSDGPSKYRVIQSFFKTVSIQNYSKNARI